MSDSDKNNLSGRLRRYAKVGGTIGGLAGKMAAARLLGRDLNQTRDAQDLEVAGNSPSLTPALVLPP